MRRDTSVVEVSGEKGAELILFFILHKMKAVSKIEKVFRGILVTMCLTSLVFYALFAWQSQGYDEACQCLAYATSDAPEHRSQAWLNDHGCKTYSDHGKELLPLL